MREDEEKERTEESREKMRPSAPRNRGSEKDGVTERGNIQRETERWESAWQTGTLEPDSWKSKPS